MGGDTTKQTQTTQNTAQQGTQSGQTTPYGPSQDLINQLLSNLGGARSDSSLRSARLAIPSTLQSDRWRTSN
jgi:hypothetical protein